MVLAPCTRRSMVTIADASPPIQAGKTENRATREQTPVFGAKTLPGGDIACRNILPVGMEVAWFPRAMGSYDRTRIPFLVSLALIRLRRSVFLTYARSSLRLLSYI